MNPKSESKDRRCGQFKKHLAVPAAAVLLCLLTAHSPAQTYFVLHTFTGGSTGTHPAALLTLSGTTLYGTTSGGGTADYGTVFKMNTDGSGYAVLHSFTNTDGSKPEAALVLSGTTLYGTTRCTSNAFGGTIFKLNVDGSGFTVLKRYTDGNGGAAPIGGLVVSGTNIYGTVAYTSLYRGGASGDGMVFKLTTDGSGYTILKSFSGTNGSNPWSALLLSGTTLYGTTSSGGAAGNCGTIFKLNTDGSDFKVLRSFTCGLDGGGPMAGLVLSGTTLYGTTLGGGSNGCGTVFKINTDGGGFAVLKNFTGRDSAEAHATLVLSGTMLFGTTANGGHVDTPYPDPLYGYGTVFNLNTNGDNYSVLMDFNSSNGTNGAFPEAGLVAAGTTLYGTTYSGGRSNCGVVFALGYPPTIRATPQTQTAEVGGVVNLAARATSDPSPTYQWFFNGDAIGNCTTNGVLCMPSIGAMNAGIYTVVINNCFGAKTSDPVVLNVIPPVERRAVPALDLLGDTGSTLNVEYADALGSSANWLPLDTVSLTGPPQYCFDLTTPLPPQRFYRVWQTGSPSVPPALNPPFLVPAITLTGNVSDHLRLDYINQFGPTDAWMTLDTVTLTNASQLYLDISAPGQPKRLYRIQPVP